MKAAEFELEKKLEKTRHKNKMEEIEFEFDCKMKVAKEKNQNDRELLRIKSAEIRRSQDRGRFT